MSDLNSFYSVSTLEAVINTQLPDTPSYRYAFYTWCIFLDCSVRASQVNPSLVRTMAVYYSVDTIVYEKVVTCDVLHAVSKWSCK